MSQRTSIHSADGSTVALHGVPAHPAFSESTSAVSGNPARPASDTSTETLSDLPDHPVLHESSCLIDPREEATTGGYTRVGRDSTPEYFRSDTLTMINHPRIDARFNGYQDLAEEIRTSPGRRSLRNIHLISDTMNRGEQSARAKWAFFQALMAPYTECKGEMSTGKFSTQVGRPEYMSIMELQDGPFSAVRGLQRSSNQRSVPGPKVLAIVEDRYARYMGVIGRYTFAEKWATPPDSLVILFPRHKDVTFRYDNLHKERGDSEELLSQFTLFDSLGRTLHECADHRVPLTVVYDTLDRESFGLPGDSEEVERSKLKNTSEDVKQAILNGTAEPVKLFIEDGVLRSRSAAIWIEAQEERNKENVKKNLGSWLSLITWKEATERRLTPDSRGRHQDWENRWIEDLQHIGTHLHRRNLEEAHDFEAALKERDKTPDWLAEKRERDHRI